MRPIATVLLLGFALTAGAAEVWRWTDATGTVHYSDQPRPGAVRISIGENSRPSGTDAVTEAPSWEDAFPGSERRSSREESNASFAYTRCDVTSPQPDETLHGVQPVNVSVEVEPALRSGHRLQVLMNGAPLADWPEGLTSYTIPEVFRGSHTLNVRVIDERGAVVCAGAPLTFHLRQQSILAPGRVAPQTAPAPRPAPGR